MRDLDGRSITSASLRGKVALINFWATWCGPCRAEIPDLVALQDKYRDQLQVIGISEDEAGPDIVRRFAASHNVNYPIVMLTPELEHVFPGVQRAADLVPRSIARAVSCRSTSALLTAATTEPKHDRWPACR